MPQDETEAQKQAQLRDQMHRCLALVGIELSDAEQEALLSNFEQLVYAIDGLNSIDVLQYEPAIVLARERIG